MRENAEKGRDVFTDSLRQGAERYGKLFERIAAAVPGEASHAAQYLQHHTAPIAAQPRAFKEGLAEITRVKGLLGQREGYPLPEDLSVFYRTLRDRGIFFGEQVERMMDALYTLQPVDTTLLTSQLAYIQALSAQLFPEVKDFRSIGFRLSSDLAPLREAVKGESKRTNLVRMLQADFEMLATRQLVYDYSNAARGAVEGDALKKEWLQNVISGKRPPLVFKGGVVDPFYSLAALRLTYEAISGPAFNMLKKEIFKDEKEEWVYGLYVDSLISETHLNEGLRALCFDGPNLAEIKKMPDVNWKDVQFSRGVLSTQRVFFEDNPEPLFFCVDPAPGKAYMAAVSISNFRLFREKEDSMPTKEAARALVTPLQRPYLEATYLRSGDSMSFFVRKSDGALCMYGDSTRLPKSQLGEFYKPCVNLVQSVMYALSHADYAANDHIPVPIVATPQALQIDEPSRGIPDAPVTRLVPPEQSVSEEASRNFLGRTAHNRLLPTGWMPGFDAWERAVQDRERISLYAKVFDETGEPVQNIELDLTIGFADFRARLLSLREQYKDRVRFQTYVKEVTPDKGV